jgi:hypothetical protein
MKGGRPAVYLGARLKDRRIRYMNVSGRTRAFYARWRPQLKRWECHLTGFGLKHQQWFETSQTMALATLRMKSCLWSWRKVAVDMAVLWDNIPDRGYGPQYADDFGVFPDAPNSGLQALPATSNDRINSESEVIDHGGLVVGSLPADQIEIYFPLTALASAAREGGRA